MTRGSRPVPNVARVFQGILAALALLYGVFAIFHFVSAGGTLTGGLSIVLVIVLTVTVVTLNDESGYVPLTPGI
jgi:hypothetical protein